MARPVLNHERKHLGYLMTEHLLPYCLSLLSAWPPAKFQNMSGRSGDSAIGVSVEHLWLSLQ